MILLDTNVISELMKPKPEKKVLIWLDEFPMLDLWTSAVTVAEIFLGIALLSGGKKKSALLKIAQQMFDEDFQARCLPFDEQAATEYAKIVSERTRRGRPISVEDAQIAAISKTANLVLATRNTKDFDGITALELVNPWVA
jgi:hypothetical protein